MSDVRGVTGYNEGSAELIPRYEALRFETVHASVLHLLPEPPGAVLDVGAGTGRDASALDARGFTVTAIEPCDAFRDAGQKMHPSSIRWINDGLPALASLGDVRDAFDVIMATAMWMHLDVGEREQGMKQVARLLKPGGRLIMSLRHGVVPEGRIMFEVSSDETARLAEACGLKLIFNFHEPSLEPENRNAGVTWSKLVFEKSGRQ